MSDALTEYYKTDSTKITFREYWKSDFSRPRVLIALLFKIFGIRLAIRQSIPWPLRLRDNLINEAELSPRATEKAAPLLEGCKQIGFQILCCQTMKQQLTPSDIAVIGLLHPNKEIVARIFFVQVITQKTAQEHIHCVMVSWLENGTFLLTSNSNEKLKLTGPPDRDFLHLAGASPNELFDAHGKRLEAFRVRNPPRLLGSFEDFEKMVDAIEESGMRFDIQRGVYVKMTPQEVASKLLKRLEFDKITP